MVQEINRGNRGKFGIDYSSVIWQAQMILSNGDIITDEEFAKYNSIARSWK